VAEVLRAIAEPLGGAAAPGGSSPERRSRRGAHELRGANLGVGRRGEASHGRGDRQRAGGGDPEPPGDRPEGGPGGGPGGDGPPDPPRAARAEVRAALGGAGASGRGGAARGGRAGDRSRGSTRRSGSTRSCRGAGGPGPAAGAEPPARWAPRAAAAAHEAPGGGGRGPRPLALDRVGDRERKERRSGDTVAAFPGHAGWRDPRGPRARPRATAVGRPKTSSGPTAR